jgi:hypothetical protein
MRAIAILIIVAVLGFFGYQFAANGRGPSEAIGVLTGATAQAEAAATAAAELEAAAAAEAEAAATAAAELEAAAAAEVEAAEAAAAELEAAAAAEVEAVETAVVEEVEAATTEAVVEAVEDSSVADLLTTDGFDADAVMEMVDGSDLSIIQKTTITTALDAAKDNPELLEAALEQLKGMLGM